MRIDHIALFCKDLEQMRQFFLDYFEAVSSCCHWLRPYIHCRRQQGGCGCKDYWASWCWLSGNEWPTHHRRRLLRELHPRTRGYSDWDNSITGNEQDWARDANCPQDYTQKMNRIIREAQPSDMADIMQVMDAAKIIMRQSGNMHQWGDGYPSEARLHLLRYHLSAVWWRARPKVACYQRDARTISLP